MERKLAAILAADVVGYSRLMGEDEAGTIAALKALRTDTIEPLIASHRGRVVKLMGDGLLVEFQSVVDAVSCAIAWQSHMDDDSDGASMRFRIGINSGDIVVDDGDIHGDGVNIAARLEGLAEPGGIALSQVVYDQVAGKVEADFEDTGEHTVKNIAKPIRVFMVRPSQKVAERDETSADHAFFDKPAIAVLPFTNMSGDTEQEYFADGITEDIMTALSLWRQFPVIARNSSFAFKGKDVDVKRVGQELGARYVLEGSVRKAGNRVRVTGQLIDADNGTHVWAERYDRELDDIFELQDDIVEQIVTHMLPGIERAEAQQAVQRRPANLGAWDLFQRGCWHFHRLSQTDMARAREYFEASLEIDPLFGSAGAFVAATYAMDVAFGWGHDPAGTIKHGIAAAHHAIGIDPKEPFARASLSSLYVFNREPERAAEEAQQAVDINPFFGNGYLALGNSLLFAGRPKEGIEAMHKGLHLSPRDEPTISLVWGLLTLAHILNQDYDTAIDYGRRALADNPANYRAGQRLACALAHKGDIADARATLQATYQHMPDPPLAYFEATYPFKDPDAFDFFIDGLRKAGWDG